MLVLLTHVVVWGVTVSDVFSLNNVKNDNNSNNLSISNSNNHNIALHGLLLCFLSSLGAVLAVCCVSRCSSSFFRCVVLLAWGLVQFIPWWYLRCLSGTCERMCVAVCSLFACKAYWSVEVDIWSAPPEETYGAAVTEATITAARSWLYFHSLNAMGVWNLLNLFCYFSVINRRSLCLECGTVAFRVLTSLLLMAVLPIILLIESYLHSLADAFRSRFKSSHQITTFATAQ